jgi:hypothetical protein
VSGGERERGSGEGDRERGALEIYIYIERDSESGEWGLRERGGERERREER